MIQESATFIQVLLDLILWVLIFLTLRKSYNTPFCLPSSSRRFGIVLILLFCLFAFWGGDYFHYKAAFIDFNTTGYNNQEKIYEWFYSTFSFSYTAFRLAIWGLALSALLWSYRSIAQSFDLALFIFGCCFLPIYSYARVSAAMSIILLGLSFIVNKEKNRLLSVIFGLTLLAVSAFFHKSAPLGIVMALAALFMVNANRTRLFIVAIMAPLIVLVIQQAFDIFAAVDLDSDTFITEHYRDRFFEASPNEASNWSIGPFVNSIVTRFPSYFIAFLYVVLAWTGDFKKLQIGERAFASYAFCVTLLSLLFSLDLGVSTNVLQYRTLYFAFPANAVFLAGVRKRGIRPKLFTPIFYLAVFSGFYQVIYAAYCALVA